MKKLLLILLVLQVSIAFSFKTNSSADYTLFSGKIDNPSNNFVLILDINQSLVKKIMLKKDNTFSDTIIAPEGYYTFSDGKEQTSVYLKPNFDLNLFLNTEAFDETIAYKGMGAKENNYLAKKALLVESFGNLNYYGYYAKLSETSFLKLTDSLYTIQSKFLNKQKKLDESFISIESKSLEFEKLNKYSSYEGMKQFVTKDNDFRVSENFPNPYDNINLSDEKLLLSPVYLNFIESYLRKKAGKGDVENDSNLEILKVINKEVKSSKIKEELAFRIGKWSLNRSTKLDLVFKELKTLINNENYLAEVTEKYDKMKKTETGAMSPNFELVDINGETVSLTDLKGKLVYIDIWATWCSPCKREIPSLAKMEEHFKDKDIQFVSICMQDTKERWQKMVKEKNMGGIQLFAPDSKISFFEDYSVQGIPRFILIDKEGKIIDRNAKRPSDPKTNEFIEENL